MSETIKASIIMTLQQENERLHNEIKCKVNVIHDFVVETERLKAEASFWKSRCEALAGALRNIENGFNCCDASINAKEALAAHEKAVKERGV